MNLRGYGCAVICMMPIGKQCASGLSLLLSATRFFTRSAAHGWYGAPPGVCPPMSPKTLPPGRAPAVPGAAVPAGGGPPPRAPGGGLLADGGAAGAGGSAPAWPLGISGPAPRPRPPALAMSQTPDKSGLPSANFGAGAFMSGFPSAVVGAPGYLGHCANTGTAATQATAKKKALNRGCMISGRYSAGAPKCDLSLGSRPSRWDSTGLQRLAAPWPR